MKKFYYLIHFQFLGFRYHGWQKQVNAKTVQGMVEKTLTYVLGHNEYKTLGSSRTDAMVSAQHSAFELFTKEPLEVGELLTKLNENLPGDINVLEIEEVDRHFNIIQHPKVKEYIYLFSFGEKNHPFCAPFMVFIKDHLDIDMMKKGAKAFEGFHNFKNYCFKPNEATILEREILSCGIHENDIFTANFFPKRSFMLKVKGAGFMRHQVRLIMGALFLLGRNDLSLDDIKRSLASTDYDIDNYMAPASGLILNQVKFD